VKAALGLAPGDAIVGFLYFGTETRERGRPAPAEWRDLVQEFGDVPAGR
jgi:hypothetical protein